MRTAKREACTKRYCQVAPLASLTGKYEALVSPHFLGKDVCFYCVVTGLRVEIIDHLQYVKVVGYD